VARTRIKLAADLQASGPLFDGSMRNELHLFLDEVKQDVAKLGLTMLDAVEMDASGRGTGSYQAGLTTKTVTPYNGPWLETGHRRGEATRFKGYHLWRRARQKLRGLATPMAQAKLEAWIARWNA
jgi:hypothetical protein